MATRDEMSLSFGAAAAAYESGRPGYPVEAVAWMLEPVRTADRAVRVADVGAGTGKLTRVIAGLGAEVVAIEPDGAMLEALHEAVPGIPTFTGTAERLPLPDAGLDAALLGQVWHWVDVAAASREMGRVLRPGGVLGLVWNFRDDRIDWVARMTRIMHPSNAEDMIAQGVPPVGAPFSAPEGAEWAWTRRMTRSALRHMVESRSYVITAEPDERRRIEHELNALFDEVGAVGDAEVELPYVTRAFRCLRLDD
jgi:SAM-dependent methyltransferase